MKLSFIKGHGRWARGAQGVGHNKVTGTKSSRKRGKIKEGNKASVSRSLQESADFFNLNPTSHSSNPVLSAA